MPPMIMIAIATTEMIARNAHWNYIRSGKFSRQNPRMADGSASRLPIR
jgi:hypothetical protein